MICFHCPTCGGDLVAGSEQFEDAWICRACNKAYSWHLLKAREKSAGDPFEKAKQIRAGELDDAMPSYDELTGWLQRVPMTWLPGLLIRVVEMCVARKVFKPGGIENTVAKAIEQRVEGCELR